MKSTIAISCPATRMVLGLTFLAVACAAAQGDRAQTTGATTAMEAWPEPELATEPIESLRLAAAVGNVDAEIVVATRLVDRLERGGAVDDLYEATIWIDRYHGDETFAEAPLIARIQQRDCNQKVLRYHWLCEIRE